jgi:hypothetical protein
MSSGRSEKFAWLEWRAMGYSRRTFCVVGMTAVAVCPLSLAQPRKVRPRLLTLSSLLVTDQAAAKRLGHLYIDALGVAAAAALVQEQEHRVVEEAPHISHSSIAALVGADFRAGRIIDVNGLRLSRLEGAVLIASCADKLPTPDIA